jgi:hypothetical protein
MVSVMYWVVPASPAAWQMVTFSGASSRMVASRACAAAFAPMGTASMASTTRNLVSFFMLFLLF